jgi:hypothetical protein
VRGEQSVNPAGRAASVRNGGNNLGEHVEAVLEPAVEARLHHAEKVRLPHAPDHVVADTALGFGLLRPLTGDLGDSASACQKIGNVRFGGRRP